jgi:hypothetical protein
MSVKDSKTKYDIKIALNTQAISSDTTTAGVKLDLSGYLGVTFAMTTGAVSAGDVTILVKDSDDNTTFTAVADQFLISTEGTLDAANSITSVGYVGKKRYVQISVVTANSANLTVGATAFMERTRTDDLV